MIKNLCFILLFIITSSLTGIIHAEKIYSVGIVPQFETRKIVEIWQPILDKVSQKTDIQLKLQTSSSIPAFEKQFTNGAFDFAYMNPYHAIVANKKQGYTPLFRDIGRSLYGIIVVKKDDPIQSVSELDRKKVAFPAPNALGAALIPRSEFAKKFNIDIEEVYVNSHSSVYLNVIFNKVAAGGGIEKTLTQQPENIRKRLRILHKTAAVPTHPFMARTDVDTKIQQKIKTAFLELGNSEKGMALLKKIPMKKIGETNMDDYGLLRTMGLEEFYVVN